MKYVAQLRAEPGGAPVVGAGVRVRRIADGVTLATLVSDARGFVTYQTSGHPPPFYFETTAAGGPRFWRSDEHLTAAALSPAEIPAVLRALGSGVRPGDGGFALTVSGTTLTLAPGVAGVAGYPLTLTAAVAMEVVRPVSGTRVDRVVARVFPLTAAVDPGYADVALVAGVVGAGAPALVQTAAEHQIALWQVSVPAAGALAATDERAELLAGYLTSAAPAVGSARVASVATNSVAGAALSGLAVSLSLPLARTYDVTAAVAAIQNVTDPVAPSDELLWQNNVGGFGSGNGQFNDPRQLAVDGANNLYVADTGNNRVQKLDPAGAWLATIALGAPPTGLAVDGGGNIYVAYKSGTATRLRKYTSAFAQQWDVSFVSGEGTQLATDGTSLFATRPAGDRVYKRSCVTGASVSSWGVTGSGNGQFKTPTGIATNGVSVWVIEEVGCRVQRFDLNGVYQAQFGSQGTANGQFQLNVQGVGYDGGRALVLAADTYNHRLQRFNGTAYVDAVGSYGGGNGEFNQPFGTAVQSNGDTWVSDRSNNRLVRFASTAGSAAGGYGQVAVEIDGNLGAYLGPGQLTCAVGNAHVRAVTGPATCSVRAFGKATLETMGLRAAVLSATATPRR